MTEIIMYFEYHNVKCATESISMQETLNMTKKKCDTGISIIPAKCDNVYQYEVVLYWY